MNERSQVTWRERAVIAIVFALVVLIVDPRGNFPLDDDWDFALATFHFARTGHFAFTPYTAVSLRAQVVWGALWAAAGGESFTVLRLSTLALSLAALLLFVELCALSGARRRTRVLAACALAASPAFFWSSFTYMTQVPFVFCGMVAMYCAARGLRNRSLRWITASAMTVCVSFLVRQTGVVNALPPLLLILVYRSKWDPRWKKAAAICAAPLAIFAVAAAATHGLAGSPSELSHHYKMWTESTFTLPAAVEVAFHYLYFNAQYLAIFFAGISFLAFRTIDRRTALMFAIAAGLFVWRAFDLVGSGHPLPYFAVPWCCDIFNGNLFVNFGLGPPTLADTWGGRPYPYVMPMVPRVVATFLFAVIGAAAVTMVVSRAWRAVRDTALVHDELVPRLAALHVVFATAILVASGSYFDRYSLDSTWAAPLLLAPLATTRRMRVAALTLTIAAGTFSLFATQEYLRWNRARWAAITELRRAVPPRWIDGGTEYKNLLIGFTPLTRGENMRFIDPRYVVAFGPLPGYHPVGRRPVTSFAGLRHFDIVTLERDDCRVTRSCR